MQNDRAVFANTINELGDIQFLFANECEKFGMTWGCRSNCPVFNDGQCKDVFYENIQQFIKNGDFDTDDFIDVVTIYEKKLTPEEIDNLFDLQLRIYE